MSENKKNVELSDEAKQEIRDYFKMLEDNCDPYFWDLPKPDFLIKENPEKYGFDDDVNKTKDILNIIECSKIVKTDFEKAKEMRKEFNKKNMKANFYKNKPSRSLRITI